MRSQADLRGYRAQRARVRWFAVDIEPLKAGKALAVNRHQRVGSVC